MAADSRITNATENPDSAQKIFQCSATGFVAIVGLLAQSFDVPLSGGKTAVATLDLMDELKAISSAYQKDEDLIAHLGRILGAKLRGFWIEQVNRHRTAFLQAWEREHLDGVLCTIPVVWRNCGIVRIYEIRFPYSPTSGDLKPPEFQEFGDLFLGWGHSPKSAEIDQPSLWSMSSTSALDLIKTTFYRASRLYPDTVGGSVEIGFVDRDGAKWLQRKGLGLERDRKPTTPA